VHLALRFIPLKQRILDTDGTIELLIIYLLPKDKLSSNSGCKCVCVIFVFVDFSNQLGARSQVMKLDLVNIHQSMKLNYQIYYFIEAGEGEMIVTCDRKHFISKKFVNNSNA
jgi:hypothetical protein